MDEMETTKRAELAIDKLGLPRPKRPAEAVSSLDWPNNVGDLSSDQLAEHMTWWTGWSGYARYHLARSETNSEALKAEYKMRFNEALTKYGASYKSVTEAKSYVENMPDLLRVKVKIEEADAIKRQVKALLEGYDAKYTVVSREISRRKADMDD